MKQKLESWLKQKMDLYWKFGKAKFSFLNLCLLCCHHQIGLLCLIQWFEWASTNVVTDSSQVRALSAFKNWRFECLHLIKREYHNTRMKTRGTISSSHSTTESTNGIGEPLHLSIHISVWISFYSEMLSNKICHWQRPHDSSRDKIPHRFIEEVKDTLQLYRSG